ncbi:hypothetical protein M3Y94_00847300 [Aphelenchoides besseyi]|nr:hypothetical protein M3Y94_00847300 [Aphelenchoides besseyi]
MTPANLSTLILSIDRYIFILHSKKIRSPVIGLVFGLTFVYSHCIYFPLQIFGRYGSSDICGPALAMSPSIGYFVQPIEPICICIAFFVNLRIVLFISQQRTSKTMALRGIRKREFKEMRFAMFGLLIQSLVPFIFTLPQTINLAAYNIDRSFRFSDLFWKIINFFVYLELSINAVVTLVFVRQFRVVFVGWIRGQQVHSTGSGGFEVIRTFTTSVNHIHPSITVFAIARRTFRSKQVQSN